MQTIYAICLALACCGNLAVNVNLIPLSSGFWLLGSCLISLWS